MNAIEIGRSGGKPVSIDLEVLLRTRLLVQANSGGGKSFLLRRLAEQLSGQAQVLIIDPEGEFSTLREHFPFVLVGRGGDTPAYVSSAALVAHKLLELGVSAVCDLFEMKVADRHAWTAAFLGALVDAPKTLWHPAVVMVDECHVFAPERGAGESEASEAVAALATRGRKRGFCLVAATQRLGKLRKDVAAELQNVLIGPTFLDLDRDRAAEVLGIPRADRKEFDHDVKVMPPGQFFALGRAVSTERIRLTVGPVVSSHPEPGSSKHGAEPPPPPDKIRHLLAKLGDLPKEAERKAQTEAELRAEVARLRNELATAPGRAEHLSKVSADAIALAEKCDHWREEAHSAERALKDLQAGLDGVTAQEVRRLRAMEQRFETVIQAVDDYRKEGGGRWAVGDLNGLGSSASTSAAPRLYLSPSTPAPPPRDPSPTRASDAGGLTKCPREILAALAARYPVPLSKIQLATLAGYAPSGGGFNNAMGELKGKGLIERDGDSFAITAAGLKVAPRGQAPRTPQELVDFWCSKLTGRAKDMLRLLSRARRPLTKDEIAKEVGMEVAAGGFNNYLGTLRSNGLVQKTRGGFEAASSLVAR